MEPPSPFVNILFAPILSPPESKADARSASSPQWSIPTSVTPPDGSFVFDGVRVFARILKRARESFGVGFHDRAKRAKRDCVAIVNAKRRTQRIERCED